MTAAKNGAINLSMPNGWMPEFATNGENCFLVRPAGDNLAVDEKGQLENNNLMETLENVVLPMYYQDNSKWFGIIQKAADDIDPLCDSGRLARQYYEMMYKV